MTRPLGLHQITAVEASPPELVTIAGDLGCAHVSLFTHSPIMSVPGGGASPPFPLVTAENKREVLIRLRERNVAVGSIEFFPLTATVSLDDYRMPLALGGELGGRRAVTHVYDEVPSRAVDRLGQLCDLAARNGLAVGLEFMGLSPACNSLARAAWFVDQVNHPGLAIAVDALHLVRTGGRPAEIAALPPRYFAYAQICDGKGLETSDHYLAEALDRLLPGDGDFPLDDVLSALPDTTDLEVEIPMATLAAAGIPCAERARNAVQRSRAAIGRSAPQR